MRSLLSTLLGLTFVAASASFARSADRPPSPVIWRDGDRVALIGGTLIEREQRYGHWEHALVAAQADKQLSFRNLGWSGDTVWAESRGIFDPPEKGYARLLEQVRELRPTVFLLHYGGNEAWAGAAGLERFLTQYRKLLDDLAQASQSGGKASAPPRFALLGPLPLEVGVGPNRDPARYNADARLYAEAISRLAAERGAGFLDLAELHVWHAERTPAESRRPLTDNGAHFTEYGFRATAPWIRARLGGAAEPGWQPVGDHPAGAAPIDSSSGALRCSSAANRAGAQVCVEAEVRLAPLPLPSLPGAAIDFAPRVSFAAPGDYRLEVDSTPVASGSAAAWPSRASALPPKVEEQSRALLTAIRDKNELYFHRWRPQNVTYLFLFRKHEQGQNAVEIPQFDPLIAAAEAKIAELRRPPTVTARVVKSAAAN